MRASRGLLFAIVLGGCGAQLRQASGPPEVDVPAYVKAYSTETRSSGVRGGPAALNVEAQLREALQTRGDKAEPDGALAATAAWVLRSAYAQKLISDSKIATAAARRFGFTGLIHGVMTASLEKAGSHELLTELVAQVPKNTPINRFGIMAGQGSDVAVVIGVVEASLADFPRSVAPGDKVRLVGEISSRFQRASVLSTNPEGKVRERRMTARSIDASVDFPNAGSYMLEIMGDGATGPVVLVNVPIRVGGFESNDSGPQAAEADPNLTVEEAEVAQLDLLNEERRRVGLTPVAADSELREVARSHSTDMVSHAFFGHVSPTMGGPEARVRKAKLRISKFGECIALEQTPLKAHRLLLSSPAHRATMLDPAFTRVGIGVAFTEVGQRREVVTLLFGRR